MIDPKYQKLSDLIEKAKELGIETEVLQENDALVRFSKNNKNIYLYGSSLPFNSGSASRIAKHKHTTKTVLKSAGLKVPKGILASNVDEVNSALENKLINFPLVVKPEDLSLGRDVFANVGRSELGEILSKLFKSYKKLVVEEYFEGEDHRVLVLDGKILAACIRSKPVVFGDGSKTIRELIEYYNLNRHLKLEIDEEVKRNIIKSGFTPESVIPAGKELTLRENSNIATGGIVADVTDSISEYFKNIALSAVREIGLRFGGVDILTPDITKDGKDYVITEVNGLPSYDIHLLAAKGRIIDVRQDILKALFR